MDHAPQLRQIINPVMDKKYLAPTIYLVLNRFFYQFIIKNMQFRNYGLAVRWWCGYNR
jgi:hypothetical protein